MVNLSNNQQEVPELCSCAFPHKKSPAHKHTKKINTATFVAMQTLLPKDLLNLKYIKVLGIIL